MKDLSIIKQFLGVYIIRDKVAGKLWLCQDLYINKLAVEFKAIGDKAPATPLPYKELIIYKDEIEPTWQYIYAKKVGSIIYPAVIIRPDVARAASKLAESLQNPGPQYLAAIDHCIRYLYSTRHLAIEFSYDCSGAELDTGTVTAGDLSDNIIFENSIDASFTNNPD